MRRGGDEKRRGERRWKREERRKRVRRGAGGEERKGEGEARRERGGERHTEAHVCSAKSGMDASCANEAIFKQSEQIWGPVSEVPSRGW